MKNLLDQVVEHIVSKEYFNDQDQSDSERGTIDRFLVELQKPKPES